MDRVAGQLPLGDAFFQPGAASAACDDLIERLIGVDAEWAAAVSDDEGVRWQLDEAARQLIKRDGDSTRQMPRLKLLCGSYIEKHHVATLHPRAEFGRGNGGEALALGPILIERALYLGELAQGHATKLDPEPRHRRVGETVANGRALPVANHQAGAFQAL